MFFSSNLVRCLHLEIKLHRLFSSERLSGRKMDSFSAKQILQQLVPVLNAAALHDMCGLIPLFLYCRSTQL